MITAANSAPKLKQKKSLAIGIDIGGTKVAAGAVDDKGNVLCQLRRPTPGRDPRAVEGTIHELVQEISRDYQISSVGVGAAGWMDLEGSTVLFSPHLAWRNEPLKDILEKLLDRRVFLVNDADAAAWAEWRFGAGAQESHMVCLTLGTGIGGSIVFDGVLERGKSGVAGEFGHQIIVPGGQLCACGNRGCLEQYASGNALGREARELARANSPMAAALLEACHGDMEAIDGVLVTQLAAKGDPASIDLIHDVGQWLGMGLANLSATLDPGMFVIGGGLCDAGDLLIDPARRAYARNLTGRGFRPPATVVKAKLGPDAGLIGAADLSRITGGAWETLNTCRRTHHTQRVFTSGDDR